MHPFCVVRCGDPAGPCGGGGGVAVQPLPLRASAATALMALSPVARCLSELPLATAHALVSATDRLLQDDDDALRQRTAEAVSHWLDLTVRRQNVCAPPETAQSLTGGGGSAPACAGVHRCRRGR